MHIALYKMQFDRSTAFFTCKYLHPCLTSQGYYTTESTFVYGISFLKKKLNIGVFRTLSSVACISFTAVCPLQYMATVLFLVENGLKFLICFITNREYAVAGIMEAVP